MELILDAFLDALIDSAKMLPLLFVIYVLIELLELKFGNRLGNFMARVGKAGPVVGAAAGIIPQCGISVVASALYTQRLLTIGTLFAVFIATSDEAIPIILSQPQHAKMLIPILIIKFVLAVAAGYLFDAFFHKRQKTVLNHIEHYAEGHDEDHDHSHVYEEAGCCGHKPSSPEKKDEKLVVRLLWHPLVHTVKVFLFIFVVSFVLALLFAFVGEGRIASALNSVKILQPFLVGLIGLIPNCAASVVITECFLSGVISFGACIAGLCSSAGLGLLVLLKEGDRKEAWSLVLALYAVAVVVGLIIQLLGF